VRKELRVPDRAVDDPGNEVEREDALLPLTVHDGRERRPHLTLAVADALGGDDQAVVTQVIEELLDLLVLSGDRLSPRTFRNGLVEFLSAHAQPSPR
jgi:hypothetical protein